MKLQSMAFGNFTDLVSVFYRQTLATTTAETARTKKNHSDKQISEPEVLVSNIDNS